MHISPLLRSIRDLKRLILRAKDSPQVPRIYSTSTGQTGVEQTEFEGIWNCLKRHRLETLEQLVLEYDISYWDPEDPEQQFEYWYGLYIVRDNCLCAIELSLN